MSAEESVRSGDLEAALEDLQARVRKAPADPKLRVFLFQLLAVLGQWDRALTQLKVAGDLAAENLAMVQTYREALRCEVLRAQIFAGKKTPVVFGEPERWIANLIESIRLAATGEEQAATKLREQAFDEAPATRGTVDGTAFEWIADGDARLGPILEVIVNGRYYFLPFHRVRSIHLEPPEDLRDLVWMPATLTLVTGGQTVALIPTRYPGSEASDSAIRMARRTEWRDYLGGYAGLGQRLFVTDAGEHALLDVRAIELETAATAEAAAG